MGKGDNKMDRIAAIRNQVHSKPYFEAYQDTNVRECTNCYSHALGATLPYLELYRIGAISKKKAIEERYLSVEEIKDLLFLDCETLQLKIEESSIEKPQNDGYKIALFVKIWANGQIGDYHFWRLNDDGVWTEKWRGRGMSTIQNFERDKLDYFPWNFVGIYKISK